MRSLSLVLIVSLSLDPGGCPGDHHSTIRLDDRTRLRVRAPESSPATRRKEPTMPTTATTNPPVHRSEPPGARAAEFPVHCPADGRVVGWAHDQDPAHVADAVRRLRANQPGWETLGPDQRAAWICRLRDWLLDNQERLTELLQSETGKPWAEAALELPGAIDVLNYYARHAREFVADQHPAPHGLMTATKRLIVAYRPYPVVGVITPWNFPVALPIMDVVPALLAGCAVVTKPSELTPLTWREIVRGWTLDLCAPDVLACVTGLGATGAAVVDEVDYVQFTGSTATGRRIAQHAGERLIPCGLELGGKDPMIVLAGADLERAAGAAVWGGLFNAGQACVSVERVYVESAVYDEFMKRVVEKVQALRQGPDPDRCQTDVGAMITEQQLQIVEHHVQDALASGARVLTGGRPAAGGGRGFFYEPTVLVDVDHSMACMREETFGPTLPVMKVASAEEAIRLANDSPYGLSASVWTGDRETGERIARRLDAGAVNLDGVMTNLFTVPVPVSGWKQSGLGARMGGAYGIRKYCRTQAITSDRTSDDPALGEVDRSENPQLAAEELRRVGHVDESARLVGEHVGRVRARRRRPVRHVLVEGALQGVVAIEIPSERGVDVRRQVGREEGHGALDVARRLRLEERLECGVQRSCHVMAPPGSAG
jgi:betaine-aldehyde dehydrogenase